MQHQKRKTLSLLAGAAAAACIGGVLPVQAFAQGKTIQLVVPYAPGGSTDILGRILAENLSGPLGTSVIVENKPGAGTAIGAGYVARSPADGSMLLMATSTTLAINPWLYKKLIYDPTKDFTAVAQVAAIPLAVIVNPSVPVKTLADLVELARKQDLNYASAGNGSPHHLVAEMFKSATGAKLNHVAYKGSSPALTDVVAGHVPLMFTDIAPALPFIQSGRVKVLAITAAKRIKALPDVPTIAESGISGTKDFEGVAWQGVVAPAGTPQAMVDKLSAEILKVMALPEVKNRLEKDGVEVRTRNAAQFAEYIKSELPRWQKVVKASGATLD